MKVILIFCPGWPQTTILLISASRVAGMSHHTHLLRSYYYYLIISRFEFSFFLNRVNSLYYFYIFFKILCCSHSWSLGPLRRYSGVGFHKMVSEFLIGRLGEHCLFPEVGGQVAVGLGDGIKGALSKAAQGGSAAPG
jgi:hypothetical protein